MSYSENNKRIAKNTIYLYIRTFLVMAIQLYTSRLILQVLGVTDLGIYNLVGGIVTMIAVLNTSQTKATSRFITYSLGKGETKKQTSVVFSQCMTIHILVSGIILILGETIGLYVVNCWTTIPADRIFAANVVYQLSLFTFVLHFIRVPYDSVIVAHEKMNIYAYMSIFEVALQLALIYSIITIGGDSLIIYTTSVILIAAILLLLYKKYVNIKFKSYYFNWNYDQQKSREIVQFTGWALMGSSANTATQQGVSLLFNNFVGLLANTALGFANQVNAAVGRFVSNFSVAFNPQIIKYYAEQNIPSMHLLMNRASKFSFALCYLMALPLIVNMDTVLALWLDVVPKYTVEFCQLIIICSIIDSISGVFNTAITATGHFRNYQIAIAISFAIDLLCAFLLLYFGVHPSLVFASRIVTRGFINMAIGLYYTKQQLDFCIINYVKTVLLPIALTIIITVPIAYASASFSSDLLNLLVSCLCSIIAIFLCMFTFLLDQHEKNKIKSIISNIICKVRI